MAAAPDTRGISYTREQLEAEAVAALPSFTRDDALALGETVLAVVRPRPSPCW